MITLFTQPGCSICRRTKAALEENGIVFESVDIRTGDGFDQLKQAMDHLGHDLPHTMPVLVVGDICYSGEDCLVAVDEGEIG